MSQNLYFLIEPNSIPYEFPLKISNLYLNRFAIDEDAAFEILGVDYLHLSSQNYLTLPEKRIRDETFERNALKERRVKGIY